MPKVKVKIEGVEELRARFEQLEQAARGPALERAVLAGAEVIRADANRRAPGPYIEAELAEVSALRATVEIGPDRAHWYYQFAETGAGGHAITPSKGRAIRFPGREGEVIRFGVGHPGHAARPFLRPAIDGQKAAAVEAVGADLRRGIAAVEGGG